MPKVSKESASKVQHVEGIIDDRSEELGSYTAGFSTFLGDMDPAPMFKGLPDDRCQCPHWGYVLKGKITFRLGRQRGDVRGGRCVLRAARAPADAVRGLRGRRVQPDRGPGQDDQGDYGEHGGSRRASVAISHHLHPDQLVEKLSGQRHPVARLKLHQRPRRQRWLTTYV